MLISTLFSLLVFIAYIAMIIYKFRAIPTSLSETYYMLGKYGTIFTVMMFACAFTILPPMLEVTKSAVQFLAFFCPAAICFVGASPNFKEKLAGDVHVTAAYISAISGLLWTILGTSFWWVIMLSMIIVGILAYKTNSIESSKTWWVEMIAFISVYLALLLSVIF